MGLTSEIYLNKKHISKEEWLELINTISNYNVICSNKVNNSLFVQDCFDLYECMFYSHIASKRFCIANMQFEFLFKI